jgi:hypothetical protein
LHVQDPFLLKRRTTVNSLRAASSWSARRTVLTLTSHRSTRCWWLRKHTPASDPLIHLLARMAADRVLSPPRRPLTAVRARANIDTRTRTGMRVVIYARFSTENQNAASIEDQATVCRVKAAALGLTVAAVHADATVSGGVPLRARSGGALMPDRFDVLVVASLCRLSRDTVDGEIEMRRLEHRGVRIIGVSAGYDNEQGDMRRMMRIVAGAMNEKLRHDIGEHDPPRSFRRGTQDRAGGPQAVVRSVA